MISLRSYAIARIGIGTAMLLAPTTASRAWLGPTAADPDARVALRLFGVRDALLGVGVLAAETRPEALPVAVGLCIAADATDAVVCLGQTARSRRLGALLATAAAVSGVVIGAVSLRDARG